MRPYARPLDPNLRDSDWTLQLYEDLRTIARALMRGERRDHTLQATALVHEAWLRLVWPKDHSESERIRALRKAVWWMRRILVDHARERRSLKRGRGWKPMADGALVDLSSPQKVLDQVDFLTLDQLITQLEARYPRQAEAVQLRLFAGFGTADVAVAFDISERTAREYVAFACAWLADELNRDAASI